MMSEIVTRQVMYTCDQCGKTSSKPEEFASWIKLLVVCGLQSRTFEAIKKVVHERPAIGSKMEKSYCGEACALQDMTKELQYLIREIAPPVDRSRFTAIQQ